MSFLFAAVEYLTARLVLIACWMLLAGSFSAKAQAPTWQWAKSPPGGVMATDTAGNVYVASEYWGSIALGAITLNINPEPGGYIAKLAPDGTCLWAVPIVGGPSKMGYGLWIRSLAVDRSGSVYIAGCYFNAQVSFGPITLVSYSGVPNGPLEGSDGFVAKLGPNQQWQWAHRMGGAEDSVASDDFCSGVSLNPAGDPLITGSFRNTATFGTTSLTADLDFWGDRRVGQFVARLNPAGDWQWAVALPVRDVNPNAKGIAVDRESNVYVGGSSYPEGAFIAKLTPLGQLQWLRATRGGGFTVGVVLDDRGYPYVAGNFFHSTLLDSLVGTGPSNSAYAGCFVAGLSPTGEWQWARTLRSESPGLEYSDGIAVDRQRNVLVGLSFWGSNLRVGGTTLTMNDNYGGGVAKLCPAGQWEWAVQGQAQGLMVRELALTASGRLYVSGSMTGDTATFGTHTILNPASTQWVKYLAAIAIPTSVCEPENPTPSIPADDCNAVLALHPNPARTIVFLSQLPPCSDIKLVQLFDATGRLVRVAQLDEGDYSFDLQGLAAGLYLVRAGKQSQPLVVE
jgi:Beta-propeller repeat